MVLTSRRGALAESASPFPCHVCDTFRSLSVEANLVKHFAAAVFFFLDRDFDPLHDGMMPCIVWVLASGVRLCTRRRVRRLLIFILILDAPTKVPRNHPVLLHPVPVPVPVVPVPVPVPVPGSCSFPITVSPSLCLRQAGMREEKTRESTCACVKICGVERRPRCDACR